MSTEGPTKPINWVSVEEIDNYDDETVLKMLEDEGVVHTATPLDTDDLHEIKGKALEQIAALGDRKLTRPVAELLKSGYVEYMKEIRKVGDEIMKNMSNDALRDYLVFKNGRYISDQELAALRNSSLEVDDWVAERLKIKEAQPNKVIALDGDDIAIAAGATRAEAMRRAQKEQGTKER